MDISNIGERILNRFRKPQKERALVFVDYEHWFFGYKNLFGLKPNIKEWYDSICTRFQVEEAFFFPILRPYLYLKMNLGTFVQ